jgi:hypothetical protein
MSVPYLRAEARDMDILTDYRITALIASERDLALRAEYARVALERATTTAPASVRQESPTGSLACVPVSN